MITLPEQTQLGHIGLGYFLNANLSLFTPVITVHRSKSSPFSSWCKNNMVCELLLMFQDHFSSCRREEPVPKVWLPLLVTLPSCIHAGSLMNPAQLRAQGAQITKSTKHISHSQSLEAQFDLVPLTFCCKSYYSHCQIVPMAFWFCLFTERWSFNSHQGKSTVACLATSECVSK